MGGAHPTGFLCFGSRKYGARRNEVRKNRPDLGGSLYSELKARGVVGSVWVAAAFCIVASAIVMLREDSVPYKPGQYVPQDVISRIDFEFVDPELLTAGAGGISARASRMFT